MFFWLLCMPSLNFKHLDLNAQSVTHTLTPAPFTWSNPYLKSHNAATPNLNEWDRGICLTYQWNRVAILTSLTCWFTFLHQLTTLKWKCRWGTAPKKAANRSRMSSLIATSQQWVSSATVANPVSTSHHPPRMNVNCVKQIVARTIWQGTRYIPEEYVIRSISVILMSSPVMCTLNQTCLFVLMSTLHLASMWVHLTRI